MGIWFESLMGYISGKTVFVLIDVQSPVWIFLEGLGRGDRGQAIMGVIHFISSMVTVFDYLGRENFRDPVLIGIHFFGTIGLHFDGLGGQNFLNPVFVLGHVQGIGGCLTVVLGKSLSLTAIMLKLQSQERKSNCTLH